MSDLVEYVVTLKDKSFLEEFYDDMETPGGDLHIPDRAVKLTNRRAISRNTYYMLTHEEAELIRLDPRVVAVMPTLMERKAIRPMYDLTGNFDRSNVNAKTDNNWGLLRCVEESNRPNWGSDNVVLESDTISINETGKNVDVIIIDGHFDPTHPEFAVNPDGSGGSRVVQLDWHTLTAQAGNTDDDGSVLLNSQYIYTPYDGGTTPDFEGDNNHGAHVAGTACGNTHGWARDASIYNISPYSTNPNGLDNLAMWDYIRAFHNTKNNNNPTICNASYGSGIQFDGISEFGKITRAIYRGIDSGVQTPNMTSAQLRANGIYDVIPEQPFVPYYSWASAADIEDAIADGIIVVGAAGNEFSAVDKEFGVDYDNIFFATYNDGFSTVNYIWAQNQGTSPSAVPGVICVGNIDSVQNETKNVSSNCGARVDIYAPGTNIMSSFNTNVSFGGVIDPRSAQYWIGKISGTSMASPQVCGMLACVLQVYPNMTPAEVLEYITSYAKKGTVGDTGGSTADLTSLQGSANRFLFYPKERKTEGGVYPKLNVKARPLSGAVYPRVRRK